MFIVYFLKTLEPKKDTIDLKFGLDPHTFEPIITISIYILESFYKNEGIRADFLQKITTLNLIVFYLNLNSEQSTTLNHSIRKEVLHNYTCRQFILIAVSFENVISVTTTRNPISL